MKRNLFKKGFTLVELLVVMAIIGILATVIISGFRASQRRSRDAKRKSDLRQIGQAMELFYSDHDFYPANSIDGNIEGCPFVSPTPTTCVWNHGGADTGKFEDADMGRLYFRELPNDIINDLTYFYISDGQSFQVFAHLENEEDQNCIRGVAGESDCVNPTLPTTAPACGSDLVEDVCNFAVTSTDVTPSDDI